MYASATTQADTPEIYEQTSTVPRANRPASYGPIRFNFENKQSPTATLVNLFENPASGSRYAVYDGTTWVMIFLLGEEAAIAAGTFVAETAPWHDGHANSRGLVNW